MNKFCCLLYSEAGAGKTPLCGTLQEYEKTSPCLFLDIDQGTMSLDSMKNKPTIVPIETFSEIQSVYPLLKAKQWDKVATYVAKHRGSDVGVQELVYKSIVIDSGTELEYRLRNSVQGGEIPTQPDYLTTQERFRKMYRSFRDLDNISLVMTAGVRELKDDVAGTIKHFPAFQPSLVADLVRMTDFVFFLNIAMKGLGEERRWVKTIQTTLSQRAVARSRSDKLKGVFEGERFYWKDILKDVLD